MSPKSGRDSFEMQITRDREREIAAKAALYGERHGTDPDHPRGAVRRALDRIRGVFSRGGR